MWLFDSVRPAMASPIGKATPLSTRLPSVRENRAVSLLVDHWDEENWGRLWWVRADGTGRVLGPDEPEATQAVGLLRARYPRQRDAGEVLAVDVVRWSGWAAAS